MTALVLVGTLFLGQELRGEEGAPVESALLPTSLAAREWPLEDFLRDAPQDTPGGQDPKLPRSPREEMPARAPVPQAAHSFCSGFLDSHFSCDNWRDYVWRDYLTEPPVLLPLGIFAAAAVVSHYDRRIQKHADGFMHAGSALGDYTMWGLGVAAFAASLFGTSPGRTGEDQFWCTTESFLAMTASVWMLKGAVDRHRPSLEGPDGTFPSGHTASAFWAAAVIQSSLGTEFGIPAYAIAVVTGLSRLDVNQHWASDVLAGAGLGILIANMFDALHFGTGREGRGICGVPLDVRVGDAGERSFSVGLTFGF